MLFDDERIIPGFENYSINRAGEVFNRITDRRMKSTHQAGRPNGFYQLYKNGKKYNKSERILYELAFGLGEETYMEDGVQWRVIEDYPNYEMSENAEVRRRDTKLKLYPASGPVDNVYYYRFSQNGRQKRFREDRLFRQVFPEIYENVRHLR